MPKVSKALSDKLRRHKVRFWGRYYIITPRLVEWVHGDGKQLIWLEPLDTRPNYYVARIDSGVSLNNADSNCFADQVLVDLIEHIEEQFGPHRIESDHPNGRTYVKHLPFPALNDSCGTSWGSL